MARITPPHVEDLKPKKKVRRAKARRVLTPNDHIPPVPHTGESRDAYRIRSAKATSDAIYFERTGVRRGSRRAEAGEAVGRRNFLDPANREAARALKPSRSNFNMSTIPGSPNLPDPFALEKKKSGPSPKNWKQAQGQHTLERAARLDPRLAPGGSKWKGDSSLKPKRTAAERALEGRPKGKTKPQSRSFSVFSVSPFSEIYRGVHRAGATLGKALGEFATQSGRPATRKTAKATSRKSPKQSKSSTRRKVSGKDAYAALGFGAASGSPAGRRKNNVAASKVGKPSRRRGTGTAKKRASPPPYTKIDHTIAGGPHQDRGVSAMRSAPKTQRAQPATKRKPTSVVGSKLDVKLGRGHRSRPRRKKK
jgi:hypothetical protein